MRTIQQYTLFPLDYTSPKGWIKEFLNRQANGLTGNIDACGYPFNTKMWTTNLLPQDDSHKHNPDWSSWWPFEQTSYYLDGANRVGIYTKNKTIRDLVKKNKMYIMSHISSNGRIGTNLNGQWWRWPYANIMRIFITDYMISKDPETLQLIINHYDSFEAKDFQDELDMANIEQLYWLFNQTGNDKYSSVAEEAYRLFNSNHENRNRAGQDIQFGSNRIPDAHGVVYIELLKAPLLLYAMTGKEEYYHDAMNGLKKMEDNFMLVSGIPSTTEHFHQRDERAAHETCNTATIPYTYGFYLRVLGNIQFADKIERAVFNGGMGSITKDFSAHQYFSAPNQITASTNGNPYGYYPDFNSFFPGHTVECCTGNVNRFMPYYVEQMYLKTNDDGVLVSLYGPSSLYIKDKGLSIIQKTNYPFEDNISFIVDTTNPIQMPIYFRIPKWCSGYDIDINGQKEIVENTDGTIKLYRTWDNDIVNINLKASVKTEKNSNGISVVRGPLVYSLPVTSEDSILKSYKKSSPEFPAIERVSTSRWNYSLKESLDLNDIEFISKIGTSYPWEEDNTPLSIKVPAYIVENWIEETYYDEKFQKKLIVTPKFIQNPVISKTKEYIRLVPYGATLLRISVFPYRS